MAREKDVEMARKGNWKGAPGSKVTSDSSKAKAVPASAVRSKPAAAKSAPKPKAKPESVKAKGYTRAADQGGGPRKGPKDMGKSQARVGASSGKSSGSGPAFVKGGGSTTISKTPARVSGASRSAAGKANKSAPAVDRRQARNGAPKPKNMIDKDPYNKGDESMKAAREKMANSGRPAKKDDGKSFMQKFRERNRKIILGKT